jgi:hypothetical protein
MIQERTPVHSKADLSTVSRAAGGADSPSPAVLSAPMQETQDADALVLAFLNDVAAHPESGIAERYKRLGISVRQGQTLKFRLLEVEMIEDREELTATGRIRKIRLMEKGQRFLARAGAGTLSPA